MSELNTTPAPTPETDKATVTTDWITGKPVVPADFARRLERERDEARDELLLCYGAERDYQCDLTTLRAVADEMEAAMGFPAISAGSARAIAFEIEQGDSARVKVTPEAKAKWLRAIAEAFDWQESALTRYADLKKEIT